MLVADHMILAARLQQLREIAQKQWSDETVEGSLGSLYREILRKLIVERMDWKETRDLAIDLQLVMDERERLRQLTLNSPAGYRDSRRVDQTAASLA